MDIMMQMVLTVTHRMSASAVAAFTAGIAVDITQGMAADMLVAIDPGHTATAAMMAPIVTTLM